MREKYHLLDKKLEVAAFGDESDTEWVREIRQCRKNFLRRQEEKTSKKMMTSEQHLEVMGKLKWKGKYPSPSQ